MAANSTSFTKTPQAGDDNYRWSESQLQASGRLSHNDMFGGQRASVDNPECGNAGRVAGKGGLSGATSSGLRGVTSPRKRRFQPNPTCNLRRSRLNAKPLVGELSTLTSR